MAADAEKSSALARKLAVAQDERQGDTRSVLRALRLALARSADETMGLAMSVIGATQSRRDQDVVGRAIAEDRLYLVLAGPNDLLGAVCIDRACVSAMLQQQTTGQVTGTAPPDRAFTETDAAMVAPFLDAFLPRAADQCEVQTDQQCLSGFSFNSRATTRRGLILTLEQESYRVFDLTVEVAGGKVQGHITLILPDPLVVPEFEQAIEGQEAAAGLEQSFGVMRAELNAVVARVRLPLSSLAGMKPGEVLPLIENRLDRIEMLSIEGHSVALARLGQCKGMRAVRMNEKLPEPEVADASEKFADHRVLPSPKASPDALDERATLSAEGLPQDLRDIELDLADFSPEDAAAEISELAGLGSEELLQTEG